MHRIVIVTLFLCLVPAAHAGDGLITKKSHYSASQTLDRLEALLRDKGLTVFARVDHAAGAETAGIPLRPTVLLIFGNPKLGSHLFTSRQSAGIDLPMLGLAKRQETIIRERADPLLVLISCRRFLSGNKLMCSRNWHNRWYYFHFRTFYWHLILF